MKQWQKNVAWFSVLIAVPVALSVLAFSFDPNSGADAAPTQSDGADSGFAGGFPLNITLKTNPRHNHAQIVSPSPKRLFQS